MEEKERMKKKQPHSAWRIGRLLAKLPASSPLLYPLYLAAQLDTVEETYASSALPPEFDGLRVAFLSDIHYGFLFKEERVRRLVERVNALRADVVLLGGDYGEHSDGALTFFQLKPGFHANIAVLATFGNHDRTHPDSNVPKIQAAMRADGIVPLLNEVYFLARAGKKLAFASTDDWINGTPAVKHVARLCRDADFTVYFPHNPDTLPATYTLRGGPFYQLALCGHTHGGQITVAGYTIKYSSEYRRRFLTGWRRENGVDIMVSNGVGTTSLPLRLGAKPQLHLITLKTK